MHTTKTALEYVSYHFGVIDRHGNPALRQDLARRYQPRTTLHPQAHRKRPHIFHPLSFSSSPSSPEPPGQIFALQPASVTSSSTSPIVVIGRR